MDFEQQVDQWRELSLAVVGAAAVLLGLVLVAQLVATDQSIGPGVQDVDGPQHR